MSSSKFSPDRIASATFESRRKGLDPDEVRSYLKKVADHVEALQTRLGEHESEIAELQEQANKVVAAPPTEPAELDEETLNEALGQHAARVLAEAKAAAADRISDAEADAVEIRAAAEELHAQRSAEADQAVQHIRDEAAALLAQRTTEADERASEILSEANAGAEQLLARQHVAAGEAEVAAENIVVEAEVVRRQILEDLSRRRTSARRQIEQLRAGRERLIASHDIVRRALDEISEELTISMSEARASAETAGHSLPDTTIEELEAEIETARLSGLLDTGPVPIVSSPSPKPVAKSEPKSAPPAEPPVAVKPAEKKASKAEKKASKEDSPKADDTPATNDADTSDTNDASAKEVDAADAVEPEAKEPTPASGAELAEVVSLDRARGDVDTKTHPASGREQNSRPGPTTSAPKVKAVKPVGKSKPASAVEPAAPKPAAAVAIAPEESDDSLDDLFASLRDGTEEAPKKEKASKKSSSTTKSKSSAATKGSAKKKSKAASNKTASNKTEPNKTQSKKSGRAGKKDAAAIDAAEVARRLKRVLADEQSRVMSSVKAAGAPLGVVTLLATEQEHCALYIVAVEPHLGAPANAKAADGAVSELVADIRRRVDEAMTTAAGDADTAVESIRSIYREIKTRSIDACVDRMKATSS